MDTRHSAGRCLLTEGSVCPRVESVYAIVPWVHKIYKHKVVSIIYLRAANSQQTANMLVRCGLARATIPALVPAVQPGNKPRSTPARQAGTGQGRHGAPSPPCEKGRGQTCRGLVPMGNSFWLQETRSLLRRTCHWPHGPFPVVLTEPGAGWERLQ